MAEQLRGPFEKFVDWRHCVTVILLRRGRHKSITAVHCQQFMNFSNGPYSCSTILKRVLLMNLRAPKEAGNFFISWGTISSSRMILLQGVVSYYESLVIMVLQIAIMMLRAISVYGNQCVQRAMEIWKHKRFHNTPWRPIRRKVCIAKWEFEKKKELTKIPIKYTRRVLNIQAQCNQREILTRTSLPLSSWSIILIVWIVYCVFLSCTFYD
jgi:hypothetical protein